MKYLGINLPKELGKLKSSNYYQIISKIKFDLLIYRFIGFGKMELNTVLEFGIKSGSD